MPLAERKQVILAKIEATYGTDPTPTAAANAILVGNVSLTPLEGSSVERDFIRQYFGSSGAIRVENYVSLEFETEIAGSGTAATAPAWGVLMRACNFDETVTAAAITGTGQSGGSTSTAKLASGASATDDFYTGMTYSTTAGTNHPFVGEITGYNGTSKIATFNQTALAAFDATSAYSIGANVQYKPNSNVGAITNTAVTMYFNIDGVRHILLGARGNCSFDMSVKKIPKIKWKFTGLLGVVSDQALPSATAMFSAWQAPVTVSTTNTTNINVLGFTSGVVENFSFDIANTITYRQLIGTESVLITDRMPKGNISLEAVLVATKDWWTSVKNATYGVLTLKHGLAAGNIISVVAPNIQMPNIKYSFSDKIAMIESDFSLNPVSGNDEVRITCQ